MVETKPLLVAGQVLAGAVIGLPFSQPVVPGPNSSLHHAGAEIMIEVVLQR